MQYHYRYETSWVPTPKSGFRAYSVDVYASLRKFITIRETPCGYWVIPELMQYYVGTPSEKAFRRWVSKTAVRSYCYLTPEAAWASYRVRTTRRVEHLEHQLAIAKGASELSTPDMRVTTPHPYGIVLG